MFWFTLMLNLFLNKYALNIFDAKLSNSMKNIIVAKL